jgi:two-component system, NtrC family, sensor histidine kinase AtoS
VTAVLVVSGDDRRRERLRRTLNGGSVFVANKDPEALTLLRYVDIDVVLRDTVDADGSAVDFVAAVRRVAPSVLVVMVGAGEAEVDADFFVPADFTQRDVDGALERATEKQRLVRELVALRARVAETPPAANPSVDPPWDGVALARVLKEFSRAFTAGFDQPRAIEMFLDAIEDLVRPSRMAVLLPDDCGGTFRIAAQRGLAQPVVRSVRFDPTRGLAHWLRRQARPARVADLDPEATRELALIHCMVAVPLLAHGELLGVLALGQPLVRPGYGAHEIETLFDLATHLATAIRDIALHHQITREKDFSDQILAHMASGVITLGRDHRIGTMNRRAEEVLGLSARDVLGRDLRLLPSPLGDMLFQALSTGRALPRSEIQLALGGRWLEVSAYPVCGEDPAPLGAVLVFDDLTAQKELAAQRRQAEQMQLLTRVVARIADEIKNPLVSINTFVELVGERFDDPDFRKDFSVVVSRDVRRLVDVFEKLVGLVNEGELSFTTVDVHDVVDGLVGTLGKGDEGPGRLPLLDVVRDTVPLRVKVDVTTFRKALSYLVWYLTLSSPADPARVSISIGKGSDSDGAETVRVLFTSRTASVPAERLGALFDPVQMVQEGLIDVGPAVSQRLVEAMGGRVQVRQARHELDFLVTLPAQP